MGYKAVLLYTIYRIVYVLHIQYVNISSHLKNIPHWTPQLPHLKHESPTSVSENVGKHACQKKKLVYALYLVILCSTENVRIAVCVDFRVKFFYFSGWLYNFHQHCTCCHLSATVQSIICPLFTFGQIVFRSDCATATCAISGIPDDVTIQTLPRHVTKTSTVAILA